MDKDVLILAIESSCDETAAAVVKNGRDVLSNIIYSQIELHKLYGGVVPEIASRKHIEKINPVITASSTLKAMGIDKDLLESTVRFSFCEFNTEEEVDYAVGEIKQLLPILRKYVRR